METIVQNIWTKSKLLVKALIIVLIVLILQLPTFYIRELIEERETRQKEAIAEVSSKWAGKQNVTGPILVLPYWQFDGDTMLSKIRRKHYASFLPDDLTITSTVTPQEKYRGIYKVMLYTSKINMSGNFKEPALDKLNIAPADVIWNEAFVQFHVSDVKGLNDELKLNWNGQTFSLVSNSSDGTEEVLTTPLNLTSVEDIKNKTFSTEFNLNGSEQLLFTPVGKSTTTTLNSTWPHPSFTGNTLPQTTEVKDSGFTANWKSLSHKRNFPQQWKDNAFGFSKKELNSSNLASASFGANLFVPVNSYQKTMRSIKYAALCILLTFAAFFIIETTNKKSVHPFQYGLIGLALVMFYTLLLSFSEYTGFNISYAVASVFTIGLIAWFVKGLLASSRLTVILSFVLVLLYTYVFTILQLQDYSLILGSIGLFLALAVVMHFSKKIQW